MGGRNFLFMNPMGNVQAPRRRRVRRAAQFLALLALLQAGVSLAATPAPATDPVAGGVVVRASAVPGDQVEPDIAVAPRDPRRILVSAIDITDDLFSCTKPDAVCKGRRNLYLSTDGGSRWKVMRSSLIGDLTAVAGTDGTFWVGGLTGPSNGELGYDVRVVRVAAGKAIVAAAANLPRAPGGVLQDRNLLAIDNGEKSPTRGRLIMVWEVLGANGYTGLVLSTCDTRLAGKYLPARCDTSASWSAPFTVPGGTGAKYAPNIATGPAGQVYLVWTGESGVVEGAQCTAVARCGTSAGFVPTVVAHASASLGGLTECRMLSGGSGNTPDIAVDLSSGPRSGRVYVTWISRALPLPDATCDPTQVSYDAYIASAQDSLPTVQPHQPATKIAVDGSADSRRRRGAAVSDEFHANVAVDERTGVTWASMYSTRNDKSRRATNVFVSRITASGASVSAGPLIQVSEASDLSGVANPSFENYYGEYADLSVVRGWPYPTWIGMHGGQRDAFTYRPGK